MKPLAGSLLASMRGEGGRRGWARPQTFQNPFCGLLVGSWGGGCFKSTFFPGDENGFGELAGMDFFPIHRLT